MATVGLPLGVGRLRAAAGTPASCASSPFADRPCRGRPLWLVAFLASLMEIPTAGTRRHEVSSTAISSPRASSAGGHS
jgi:hypothetical protein